MADSNVERSDLNVSPPGDLPLTVRVFECDLTRTA
jgi:hypothetical protein